MKLWLIAKWKWVVGIFSALLVFALTLLRISNRNKENVENIKELHEKENKIKDKARDDLVDGLNDISEEKDKKIEEINRESDDDEKKLEKEKQKFIDDATRSDDLARKIADHLDAEFIDADDE